MTHEAAPLPSKVLLASAPRAEHRSARGGQDAQPRPVDMPSPGRAYAARRSWPPAAALVTGGTSGIGAAVAAQLARLGTHTAVVGRSAAQVEPPLLGLPADLTQPTAAARVATATTQLLPDLDLLVCCAGIGCAEPFAATSTQDLERLVALNVTAPLELVQALLPGMQRRGGGRVVLVGSIAGALGVPGESAYSATKSSVHTLARALRGELAGTNVHVTLVIPGVVDTAFFARRGVPYSRRFPRPLPAERVAAELLVATRTRKSEVYVPRWLGGVARLRALAPGMYDRLAGASGTNHGLGHAGLSQPSI